jgi:hypothetical protein
VSSLLPSCPVSLRPELEPGAADPGLGTTDLELEATTVPGGGTRAPPAAGGFGSATLVWSRVGPAAALVRWRIRLAGVGPVGADFGAALRLRYGRVGVSPRTRGR